MSAPWNVQRRVEELARMLAWTHPVRAQLLRNAETWHATHAVLRDLLADGSLPERLHAETVALAWELGARDA